MDLHVLKTIYIQLLEPEVGTDAKYNPPFEPATALTCRTCLAARTEFDDNSTVRPHKFMRQNINKLFCSSDQIEQTDPL